MKEQTNRLQFPGRKGKCRAGAAQAGTWASVGPPLLPPTAPVSLRSASRLGPWWRSWLSLSPTLSLLTSVRCFCPMFLLCALLSIPAAACLEASLPSPLAPRARHSGLRHAALITVLLGLQQLGGVPSIPSSHHFGLAHSVPTAEV